MKQPQPSLTKILAEGVAFFFPVVDAAPVHDHRRRQLLGQAQMANNRFVGFVLEGDGDSLHRDVEIFRRGEKHLAGLAVAMMFPRRAREGMAGDAVVAVGFQKGRFGRRRVAGLLGSLSLGLPIWRQVRSTLPPKSRLRNWPFSPAPVPTRPCRPGETARGGRPVREYRSLLHRQFSVHS